MKTSSRCHALAAGGITACLFTAASQVSADPLELYLGPSIDPFKANPYACLNVGDAVSCSAGMMNVLSGLDPTAKTTDATPGFVIASPQGGLKSAIVLGSGGNAATGNDDTDPTVGKVEDGFKTNSGKDNFAATGKAGTTAGNLGNPDNNLLNSAYDQLGTWDVDIDWLIKALTVGGSRRELMIGFDYNDPSAANSTSVSYWSLITVLDYDASGNIQRQKNFEIKNFYGGYGLFTSTKTFNSQPDGSEFATVNGVTCYKKDGSGNVIDVIPIPGGSCPAGYDHVNNAQGDSTTEIIAFLPELNAGLEAFLADGFDAISVRMLFGCFGGTDPKAGVGYLSGGLTTNCDGGGNVDVYLLGGEPNKYYTPEPGTLALLGLGLAGLAATRRRKQ